MQVSWKDFGNIVLVGEQLFTGILALEAGGPATLEVSVHGKKYDVTIAPKVA